jgi:cell division protein FtsB
LPPPFQFQTALQDNEELMELLQSTSVLSQRLEDARSPRAPSPASSLKHQLENTTRERDMLREQISQLQTRHQADTNTLMDQVRECGRLRAVV